MAQLTVREDCQVELLVFIWSDTSHEKRELSQVFLTYLSTQIVPDYMQWIAAVAGLEENCISLEPLEEKPVSGQLGRKGEGPTSRRRKARISVRRDRMNR